MAYTIYKTRRSVDVVYKRGLGNKREAEQIEAAKRTVKKPKSSR
jgi:hypothetical protein